METPISKPEFAPNQHSGGAPEPEIIKDIMSNRDRDREKLKGEDFDSAILELNNTSFVKKFPRTFKYSADPTFSNQVYSLHSFIPSKGAKADKDGVFGMIKFRGTFGTNQEAQERSEQIIKDIDSAHSIFHGYVGKWFPVTQSSKYTDEIHEVDIQTKTKDVVSKDLKAKQRNDKQELREIEERKQKLMEDVKVDKDIDPTENYTELQVKRANILYSRDQYLEALAKIEPILEKTKVEIKKMDSEDSNLRNEYIEKYKDALKEAGIPSGKDNTLIKYMNVDVE